MSEFKTLAARLEDLRRRFTARFVTNETDIATNASDLADHLADTTDAHDASAISVADAGGYYTGTEVEAALQEVGSDITDLQLGGWVSFTPSWSNFTLGNGTINAAEYAYTTNGMWVRIGITLGSTSSITGALQLTVPNSETIKHPRGATGTLTTWNGSRLYPLAAYSVSSSVIGFSTHIANGIVNATTPYTFGTGDNFGGTVFVGI